MAGKKRILIVEDNHDCRELLTLLVKRLGYEVVEAANGLAAVDAACANHPDLILMDLGLPGITGDEATVRLKANHATQDIPIIINSAFQDNLLVKRALAAGAAEILQKPVDLVTLREVLRRYTSTEDGNAGTIVETKNQPLCLSPMAGAGANLKRRDGTGTSHL